jgi:hypothetical protein
MSLLSAVLAVGATLRAPTDKLEFVSRRAAANRPAMTTKTCLFRAECRVPGELRTRGYDGVSANGFQRRC